VGDGGSSTQVNNLGKPIILRTSYYFELTVLVSMDVIYFVEGDKHFLGSVEPAARSW
jgi:hypothetical protein